MIIPVILAGGSGTRLWPVSSKELPKQFSKLIGDETLFQLTLNRLEGISGIAEPIIICNQSHQELVQEQLPKNSQAQIILEPIGRNTAPAIAVAAMHIIRRDASHASQSGNPILLVLPSDSAISDTTAFHQAIESAKKVAMNGNLVCFGVIANRPETGYGYIKYGKKIYHQNHDTIAYKIEQFVEKPNIELAKQYITAGNYYWNSGMFMFHAKYFLDELAQYAPDILATCEDVILNSEFANNLLQLPLNKFAKCRSESIDYAIMEKTNHAVVVPLDAGWNDIGSWRALWEYSLQNCRGTTCCDQNNVVIGDVFAQGVSDSYIRAENRKVVVIGMKDCVVIETDDAVLVTHKNNYYDIKKILEEINV